MLVRTGLPWFLVALLLVAGPSIAQQRTTEEGLLAAQALAMRNRANLGDWQRIGFYCDFVEDRPGALARRLCDIAAAQIRRAAEEARVELYAAPSPEAYGMSSAAGMPYLVARIATAGPGRAGGPFHVSLRAVIAFRGSVPMLSGRERVERERRGDLLLWEATMTGSAAESVTARELEPPMRQLVQGFFEARGGRR